MAKSVPTLAAAEPFFKFARLVIETIPFSPTTQQDIPLHNHTERQLYLRPNLVSEIMAMRVGGGLNNGVSSIDALLSRFRHSQLDNTVPISRFDARDGSMTAAHFRKHCSDRPWMITGIPQHCMADLLVLPHTVLTQPSFLDNWPAATTWNTREKFLERHGNVPCKVRALFARKEI